MIVARRAKVAKVESRRTNVPERREGVLERVACEEVVFFFLEREGRAKYWGARRSKKKKIKRGKEGGRLPHPPSHFLFSPACPTPSYFFFVFSPFRV